MSCAPLLCSCPLQVTVVPADYPAEKVLDMNPDGVFFSNGPVSGCRESSVALDCQPWKRDCLAKPYWRALSHAQSLLSCAACTPLLCGMQGDPSAVPYAVENAKQILGKKPVFGICMGHQVCAQGLRREGGTDQPGASLSARASAAAADLHTRRRLWRPEPQN